MPVITIVDTNILVDIFLQSRYRHNEAKSLGQLLSQEHFVVRVPMHSLFELASALKNEKMVNHSDDSMPYNPEYNEKTGFQLLPVPIDQGFVDKYLDSSLPYLKGKDFIFLCMAKKDGAELITEDNNLYKAAKTAGINVYRIKEFLTAFSKS